MIQIWLSINENYNDANYTVIGNVVNGRKLIRFILDKDSDLDNTINILHMNGANPVVIGIQKIDGSDFDAVKYPKNLIEFNQFTQPFNVFQNGLLVMQAVHNTGAGWADFNTTL